MGCGEYGAVQERQRENEWDGQTDRGVKPVHGAQVTGEVRAFLLHSTVTTICVITSALFIWGSTVSFKNCGDQGF